MISLITVGKHDIVSAKSTFMSGLPANRVGPSAAGSDPSHRPVHLCLVQVVPLPSASISKTIGGALAAMRLMAALRIIAKESIPW